MSRREDYEEEYEDELDRMRAQRRRKAGTRAGEQHASRSYPAGPEIRSQQRNAPDLEDDFEITYLEVSIKYTSLPRMIKSKPQIPLYSIPASFSPIFLAQLCTF